MKHLEKLIVVYWEVCERKEEMEKLGVIINYNVEDKIISAVIDILGFPEDRFGQFSRDWLRDIVFDCKEKNENGAKKIIKTLIAFSKKL